MSLARLTASLLRFAKRRRIIFDRTDETSLERRILVPASAISRAAPLPPNFRTVLFTDKYLNITSMTISSFRSRVHNVETSPTTPITESPILSIYAVHLSPGKQSFMHIYLNRDFFDRQIICFTSTVCVAPYFFVFIAKNWFST